MEKQVALGSFVADFPQTLSLCAIFALVQPFLWKKRTLLMLYLFYKKYFFRPLRRLYI